MKGGIDPNNLQMFDDPDTQPLFVDSPPTAEEQLDAQATRSALDESGITQVPWKMVGNSTKEELDFMCVVSQFAYHWDDKAAFEQYLKKENNPTEDELRAQGYEIQYIEDQDSKMQCALITKGDEIYIGFRGTLVTRTHIAKDFNATLVTAGFIKEGRLHGGFYHGVRGIMPKLSEALDQHAKKEGKSLRDYNFRFTGHSMGGALAKISALYMNKEWGIDPDQMRVATFGDPRTFDITAAKIYDEALGKNTVRISEYDQDLITALPSGSMGFKHVGELIKIKTPQRYSSHVMNGYQRGMRNIQDKEFIDARAVTRLYRLSQAIRLILDYIPEKIRYAVKHIKKNWLGIKHWHETMQKPESLNLPPPEVTTRSVGIQTEDERSLSAHIPLPPPEITRRSIGIQTVDEEHIPPPPIVRTMSRPIDKEIEDAPSPRVTPNQTPRTSGIQQKGNVRK